MNRSWLTNRDMERVEELRGRGRSWAQIGIEIARLKDRPVVYQGPGIKKAHRRWKAGSTKDASKIEGSPGAEAAAQERETTQTLGAADVPDRGS